jgi:sulfur carrier protein
MKLQVNGNEVELREGASVQELLTAMRYSFPLIVIKVNGILVPREGYATATLKEGDLVDAYHLVSGG